MVDVSCFVDVVCLPTQAARTPRQKCRGEPAVALGGAPTLAAVAELCQAIWPQADIEAADDVRADAPQGTAATPRSKSR
jgi:hypothetical protein